MNTLVHWALGYLVNSLWMVPLVFAAAWLMTPVARGAGAQAEHAVWVSALLLESILPACGIGLGGVLRAVREVLLYGGRSAGAGDAQVSVSMGAAYAYNTLALPRWLMALMAAMYGCVMLYFVARFMWAAWKTFTVAKSAMKIELTGEPARVWERCRSKLEAHHAEVAESQAVSGPVTLGILQGLLLLPHGFLNRAGLSDLEAVMAHECAHMWRSDFAKNLLYRAISLPVAYHPVLWLTERRIAESREMVCDAIAAEFVQGRERYAKSLLRLASMVVDAAPIRTLHTIGIFDANTFERRVMRLTGRRVEMGRALRLATTAACVVVGAAMCASALALRVEVASPNPAAIDKKEAPSTVKVAPGIVAGNVIYQKHPVYPAEARANHVEGSVVMAAVISKEGTVERLAVISGPEALRASSLDAVKEWRYQPYLLNGQPVEVETTITVNYALGK